MRIIITIFCIIFYSANLNANTSFFKEGVAYYNKSQFDKAKFKFEQNIVYNPKSEKSYLYLSKIFNIQNKIKNEEQNLKTVILLNPKNEEAIYNLAKLKLSESDYKESKKLIEKLLTFCENFCEKSKSIKIEI